MFNVWHDLESSRVSEDSFTAVVEIPRGSKVKYELDKGTGFLKLDRILHAAVRYPMNYGFIPLTYAEDNDPLDVLIVSDEAILPLTLVQCKPIGILHMIDDGERDEKVIAVPFGDPLYKDVNDIKELPKYMFDEISHFFTIYKMLENKSTSVEHVDGTKLAKEMISKSLKYYSKMFPNNESV